LLGGDFRALELHQARRVLASGGAFARTRLQHFAAATRSSEIQG
jgi:hypothetical protein